MPRDPVRSARIDDETWDTLLETSLRMGVSVSEVIRKALGDFLKQREAA